MKIYLDVLVFVFDGILFDVLVEKFYLLKIKFGDISVFMVLFLCWRGSSDVWMDFEGILFVFLDLDGVEEFSDIVLWFRFFFRRVGSDFEIVYFEDGYFLEGFFLFFSFGFLFF